MLFPQPGPARHPVTSLLVDDQRHPHRLPVVRWAGPVSADLGPVEGALGLLGDHQGVPLLLEHAHGSFERPGLRGHRLADRVGGPRDVAGRA